MKLLKKIARKILKDEISKMERDLSFNWEKKAYDVADELEKVNKKYTEDLNKALAERNIYQKQLDECTRKLEDVTKENEILRKYYNVDEEPSPSIQAKILLNLKVNDLQRELQNAKMELSNERLLKVQAAENTLNNAVQYMLTPSSVWYTKSRF